MKNYLSFCLLSVFIISSITAMEIGTLHKNNDADIEWGRVNGEVENFPPMTEEEQSEYEWKKVINRYKPEKASRFDHNIKYILSPCNPIDHYGDLKKAIWCGTCCTLSCIAFVYLLSSQLMTEN